MAPAKIEGDDIVIRVPIAALPIAMAAGQFHVPIVVENAAVFAVELVRAINAEEEDGTTRAHRMLDAAAWEAFENGAEGCREGTEDEIEKMIGEATP